MISDREAVARLLGGYLDALSWIERPADRRETRARELVPGTVTKADLLEMADAAIACLRERWDVG